MSALLALDSSTETMALALIGPDGALHLAESAGGPQASARLVPEAMGLLAGAGLGLAQLDAIGFGRGPGAFTGLRTACAVVQGLAFGAGKPVLSLDSLMLVAEDARQQAAAQGAPLAGPIWVAMDARMGEIYAAAYQFEQGHWQTLTPPALYSPEALRAQWPQQGPAAVAGSALIAFEGQLGLAPETRAWPQTASRAAALAALAAQAWARGETLDPAQAMPAYVRDKVALTTEERMAVKLGSADSAGPAA